MQNLKKENACQDVEKHLPLLILVLSVNNYEVWSIISLVKNLSNLGQVFSFQKGPRVVLSLLFKQQRNVCPSTGTI